jgi:peptidoglycan-associated lipoprotein
MLAIIFLFLSLFSIFAEEVSIFQDGKFGYPLNTQNSEYCPVIAPNSRYLVFQSNRPGGLGGMDLWISENKNFKNRTAKPIWAEPKNFSELNSSDFEGPFSIFFDTDGRPKEIYFTSRKSSISGREGFKGLNIYYTQNLTQKNPSIDEWSKPIPILEISSHFEDKMPTISPDGNFLIFSSNRPGGFGGFDLWISHRDRKENKWSSPVNLGPKINSSANEIMPSYHYDGLSLFFSSDRMDEQYKFNFYMADFEDDSQILSDEGEKKVQLEKNSKPLYPLVRTLKKLSMPFNSSHDDEGISLSHDGLWIYFSSNRIGGEGQFDIYRAPVTEDLRKPYAFNLYGLVVDGSEKTMIGLDSTIKVFNEKGLIKIITSKRIGGDLSSVSKDEPTNFKTKLLTGSKYRFEVSSPGFHPNEFTLDITGNVGSNKSKYMKIILLPVEEVEVAVTKPENPQIDPEKIPEFIRIILRDSESKKFLVEGKVIFYNEEKKEGMELKRDAEYFKIDSFPQGDFELTGSASGYSTETLLIRKDDTIQRSKKELTIDLNRLPKGSIYEKSVLFDFSEANFRKDEIPKLKELVSFLKKNKDRVEIGGHTDNIDSKEFNVKLSQKRADVVKEFLVSQGIDESRLETRAYWYSQPIDSNETPEGRAKNRRVSFKKIEK